MKIALILPPMSLEERYGKAISKVAGTFPPLGLLSLGTVLKAKGHIPLIIDGSRTDYKTMTDMLERENPDIIGISVMTFIWPKSKKMIAEFRAKFPGAFIIAGGVHPTISGMECMEQSPELDAVVLGEGEITLPELAEKFRDRNLLESVKGIIYRKDGIIKQTQPREIIADLDSLPIPDRSLLPIADYVPAFSQYSRLPVTNMFTTRGCPFKCLFCIPDVLGKKVRSRSVDSVITEIKYLVKEYGIRDIAIWDDTFTLFKNRVEEFVEKLKANNINIAWSAQARADKVDLELFKKMKKAGCWKLHFGFESMVQKNLDFIMKGTSVEQNINAVKITKQAGIEVEASFIFGIPGETYEDGLKTIETVAGLGIDYVRFFSLTPYGTFCDKISEYGTILTDDLSRYQSNEIVFVPDSMTKEQLQSLISKAYRRAYFNPRYVLKRLGKLNSLRSVINTIRGAKAVFMLSKSGNI